MTSVYLGSGAPGGLVLGLELIGGGFRLMVPMIAATLIATAIVRHIDGYSIYSACLAARGN